MLRAQAGNWRALCKNQNIIENMCQIRNKKLVDKTNFPLNLSAFDFTFSSLSQPCIFAYCQAHHKLFSALEVYNNHSVQPAWGRGEQGKRGEEIPFLLRFCILSWLNIRQYTLQVIGENSTAYNIRVPLTPQKTSW